MPHIVKIPAGKFGLWYATGRAAYRAQAQAFIRGAGGAELDDVDGHDRSAYLSRELSNHSSAVRQKQIPRK